MSMMDVDSGAPAAPQQQQRSSSDDSKVEVRFVTSLPEDMKVTETPFSVPSRLTRLGLSEVVNHLLATSSPVPFDFLVGNEFLRTTLARHMAERGIAAEGTITVEYTLAVGRPSETTHHEHGDWVACACAGAGHLLASGTYDARLRVWSGEQQAEASVGGAHAGPIKAVAALARGTGVATGGKDGVVKLWSTDGDCAAVLSGHTDAVAALDASPEVEGQAQQKLCSASWDKTIRLWDASVAATGAGTQRDPAKKRRKTEADTSSAEQRSEAAVLKGHTEGVTSVQWPTWAQLISGSHDHTIRLWDAERAACVTTIVCEKSVLCVSYSVESGVCASGHHDGALRMWDPRAEPPTARPPTARVARSHKGWISCLAWHPSDAAMLATGSYDGSLKLWDLRSPIPLLTVAEAHGPANKVLCLAWAQALPQKDGEEQRSAGQSYDIVTGGTDGRLTRRSLPRNLRH
eukprot:m51a1_g6039 putative wd40 repeat-containing protein (461) ;mRNA; f:161429-163867